MATPTTGSLLKLLYNTQTGSTACGVDVYFDNTANAMIAVYKAANSASGAPNYGFSPMFASWITIPSDWPTTPLQSGSQMYSLQVTASNDGTAALPITMTRIEKIGTNRYFVMYPGYSSGVVARANVLNSDGAGTLTWATGSTIIGPSTTISTDICKLADGNIGVTGFNAGAKQFVYSASLGGGGQALDTIVLRATSAAVATSGQRFRAVRLSDNRFMYTNASLNNPPTYTSTWDGISTLTTPVRFNITSLGGMLGAVESGVVGLCMSDGNTIIAYPDTNKTVVMSVLNTQTDTALFTWSTETVYTSPGSNVTDVQLTPLDTTLNTFALSYMLTTGSSQVWTRKYRYLYYTQRFYPLNDAQQVKSFSDGFTITADYLRSCRVNDDRIAFIGTNTNATSSVGLWLVQLNESSNNMITGSGNFIKGNRVAVPGGTIRFKY